MKPFTQTECRWRESKSQQRNQSGLEGGGTTPKVPLAQQGQSWAEWPTAHDLFSPLSLTVPDIDHPYTNSRDLSGGGKHRGDLGRSMIERLSTWQIWSHMGNGPPEEPVEDHLDLTGVLNTCSMCVTPSQIWDGEKELFASWLWMWCGQLLFCHCDFHTTIDVPLNHELEEALSLWGSRDDSVVKSTGWSSEGPGFHTQHPHGG